MEYSLLFICLCLDVWLCLKMGSENMVLVRLLQRGANDLTVGGEGYDLKLEVESNTGCQPGTLSA